MGVLHPDYLGSPRDQQILTSRQWADWVAYYRWDPWDNWRGDYQAGVVAAAAVAPHLKKGAEISPKDFLPRFGKRKKPQSEEDMKAVAERVAAAWATEEDD